MPIEKLVYDENNIFAKIIRGDIPSFKVYEDETTYVMMDIMPESRGHLLILTKESASTFFDLSEQAAVNCIKTAKKIAPALMKVTKADGLVLKQYNYAVSGQTIFHVHYHLIPCYEGQISHNHAKVQGDMEDIKALAEEISNAIK